MMAFARVKNQDCSCCTAPLPELIEFVPLLMEGGIRRVLQTLEHGQKVAWTEWRRLGPDLVRCRHPPPSPGPGSATTEVLPAHPLRAAQVPDLPVLRHSEGVPRLPLHPPPCGRGRPDAQGAEPPPLLRAKGQPNALAKLSFPCNDPSVRVPGEGVRVCSTQQSPAASRQPRSWLPPLRPRSNLYRQFQSGPFSSQLVDQKKSLSS